ncbi:hypothetical protein D3C71_2066770 [compost metagenome]
MLGREVAQAVAKAAQRVDATPPGGLVEVFVRREAGSKPHGLAQGIHLEDLAGGAGGRGRLVHPPDHQAEAVGTHVDGGQQAGILCHCVRK